MSPFLGIPVIVDKMLDEVGASRVQVRFPRSKKKRIRKKWAKDPRNWRTDLRPYVLLLNPGPSASVLCNTPGFVEVRKQIEEQAAASFGVPAEILGDGDKCNFASTRPLSPEEMLRQLASIPRRPRPRPLFDPCEPFLLTPKEPEHPGDPISFQAFARRFW